MESEIYRSNSTNAIIVIIREKRSQNYLKMQVGVWRHCKLPSWSMTEP